jgi:hypothetical protein
LLAENHKLCDEIVKGIEARLDGLD